MKATLFTRKRIEIKESKVDGIYNYDVDNAYPQRVMDIINNSVTGVSCVNLYAKFIEGRGFKDQNFYKIVVNNDGLTNDKLLRILCLRYAKLRGFAIHINYNAAFEAVEFTPVPFQFCRKTLPDSDYAGYIAVYDDWDKRKSKKVDREKIAYYRPFNPDPLVIEGEVLAAGGFEHYNGQLWWFAASNDYPLAPCDAVLEDMQSEGHAKIFKYRNITTNFLASHFLITDKKENSGVEENVPMSDEVVEGDAEQRIVRAERKDSTSRQEEEFAQHIEDFQGSDEAMKVCWIQKDSPEQEFKLEKVDIQDVEDLYQFTEDRVRDNIIRCFVQPPVLVGVAVAGKLGTSKEIKDATDFYNNMTASERIMMEEVFARLFSIWKDKNITTDYSILPVNSFQDLSSIPPELLKDLSVNERRALIEHPELPQTQADNKKLIETLSVGSVTAIIAVLTDAVLTVEQKKGTLMTFGFSEAEANTMLNIKSTDPTTTTTTAAA